MNEISQDLPVILPVHPRTKKQIAYHRIQISENARLHLINPLSSLEFLSLRKNAAMVITDSGGIQEDTTYLKIPCLTL